MEEGDYIYIWDYTYNDSDMPREKKTKQGTPKRQRG